MSPRCSGLIVGGQESGTLDEPGELSVVEGRVRRVMLHRSIIDFFQVTGGVVVPSAKFIASLKRKSRSDFSDLFVPEISRRTLPQIATNRHSPENRTPERGGLMFRQWSEGILASEENQKVIPALFEPQGWNRFSGLLDQPKLVVRRDPDSSNLSEHAGDIPLIEVHQLRFGKLDQVTMNAHYLVGLWKWQGQAKPDPANQE